MFFYFSHPIPEAARSMAWVYARLLEFLVRIRSEAWMSLCC